MNKVIDFFKKASPVKLTLIGLVVGLIAVPFEKSFPNIFMGLRILGYGFIISAIIRYFSSK